MQKHNYLTIALFSLLSSASFATAPSDGWYFSGFGGAAYTPDNVSVTYKGQKRSDTDYDVGFNAGGVIGYKGGPIRYEIEASFIRTNTTGFKLDGVEQTSVTGHNESSNLMTNIIYDFDKLNKNIAPYLGIGLGYAYVETQLNSTSPSSSTFERTGTEFAYQVLTGINYNLNKNLTAGLGYTYFVTNEVDELGKVFQAHLANLNIIYHFDQPAEAQETL